jgi:dihydrofolate reductase
VPSEVVLIAAVTVDGFIARHSNEITSWTKDLSLFKKQTMGHPVIMGSNTYKTLSNELSGRDVIVINRNHNPKNIISNIKQERCFIAGGGKIYSMFYSFLTHLYITPHPYVFGKGISLFSDTIEESNLIFEKIITVSEKNGIFQYQYKINK